MQCLSVNVRATACASVAMGRVRRCLWGRGKSRAFTGLPLSSWEMASRFPSVPVPTRVWKSWSTTGMDWSVVLIRRNSLVMGIHLTMDITRVVETADG